MTKLRLIILILAVSTPMPKTAVAEWPERPVHFVVPYPAGGATDVAARIVANFDSVGQQIVVENRSGAPTATLASSAWRKARIV
jgi:tripartite-type tricarboxylate transporter receptor subunit TctC